MHLKQRNGFTLIEVLAVLSILGLLASLLVPSVNGAIARAKKTRFVHNLQQIGLIYSATLPTDGIDLSQAETVAEWAFLVRSHGGENRPDLYLVPEDYLIHSQRLSVPKFIASRAGDGWQINGAFATFPLGVTIIVGVGPDCPSTTPIAYSRGLDPETGRWKPSTGDDGGIYGADEGFILFLDGHVETCRTLVDGPLLDFETGSPTADIRRAAPPGARAINWRGTVWSN